jgi:hypothetical protein
MHDRILSKLGKDIGKIALICVSGSYWRFHQTPQGWKMLMSAAAWEDKK